ncbi:hypothetical protein [Sciscionella sediminilitoris]|uniref:hypothetical protein n=1 Tax=Sciscionella sediminilitoris TaxID=1445613 RepID=UPI0012E1142F|nr:hypothetical protein [Sciscionella sp. SE31]
MTAALESPSAARPDTELDHFDLDARIVLNPDELRPVNLSTDTHLTQCTSCPTIC